MEDRGWGEAEGEGEDSQFCVVFPLFKENKSFFHLKNFGVGIGVGVGVMKSFFKFFSWKQIRMGWEVEWKQEVDEKF